MDNLLEKLVERAAEGDEKAISELVTQTQDRMYRFCMYLCANPSLAQDICQDAYVKALENLKKLKNKQAFISWMYRIIRNLFLDHLKAADNKEKINIETMNLEDATGKDPDLIAGVWETLLKMSPKDRFSLLLVDMEGYSYGEAAEIIGISEDALRSRLHRARKDFLEKFQSGETISEDDSSLKQEIKRNAG